MPAGQQNGLTDDAQNRSVNRELSSRFLTGIADSRIVAED
jgi:hypothetical protein